MLNYQIKDTAKYGKYSKLLCRGLEDNQNTESH